MTFSIYQFLLVLVAVAALGHSAGWFSAKKKLAQELVKCLLQRGQTEMVRMALSWRNSETE